MDSPEHNKRFKAANGMPIPRATVNHTSSGLKLTVKAPPSKLRKVTSAIPPNPYAEGSESDATPQPAARAARSTRNPKAVVDPDTDEVDDGEEDAEGEDDDEMEDAEDSDADADAEGEDDDMDELADPHPPPPVIKQTSTSKGKPQVQVTAPNEGPLNSVEAKETEDDDDDEELSELDEDMDEDLPGTQLMDDDDDDDNEEDLDSDEEDFSRSATPDLSKLTRRQRGLYEEVDDNGLMALSNEAQKKKQLTAEEQGMRRQEMARRRKNLSEKRNEEEKMDTINKLLNKPAPKRRTRAEIIAQQHADAMANTPGAEDGEEEKPDPVYSRYVTNAKGSRLGVPEEWLGSSLGAVLAGKVAQGGGGAAGGWSGRMVEEVV